jgi:hypothetical protein
LRSATRSYLGAKVKKKFERILNLQEILSTKVSSDPENGKLDDTYLIQLILALFWIVNRRLIPIMPKMPRSNKPVTTYRKPEISKPTHQPSLSRILAREGELTVIPRSTSN